MAEVLVYLKPNFVAEPLVDSWYAWAHLISPATACMNIRNRHLSIMKSYVMAPMAHAAAVRNPKMRGGPFIDYDGKRKDDVKALMQHTQSEHGELVGFAEDLEALDNLLKAEGKGGTLIPLYAKIPERLRGYVELVYDLNDQPGYRLKESLLYRSEFYKPAIQSLQCYLLHADDDRPFVFSTPRLEDEEKVMLHIPFSSTALDALFRMQRTAGSFSQICEDLGVPDSQRDLFRTFFSETAPEPYGKYEGPAIRTRYFGHACILIETREVSILLDPVISYGYDAEVSRLTYKDLPDHIDYVLITHNHQDHILLETMLQLRHKTGKIIVPRNGGGSLQDPSLKLMLENIGFEQVHELSELDRLELPFGFIDGLPFFGEHGDLDVHAKLGYFINIRNYRVIALADSNNIEPYLYTHLHKLYGDADVLFLGMECEGAPYSWLYGPYVTGKIERAQDQERRLSGSDFEAGMQIVTQFGVKEAYVYAMGQEPWIEYLTSVKYTETSHPIIQSNLLVEACQAKGILAERLFGEKELLAEGELIL